MKQVIKTLAFFLALSSLLFISGCSGSGGGYSSTSYSVYSGYGYPAGYGYGYRYDDIDIDIDRNDRMEARVDRRANVRTHTASRSGSMGRPAGMSRGGGGRRR